MQNRYSVNEVLDILDRMPQEEQNLIIEILKNRVKEKTLYQFDRGGGSKFYFNSLTL